MIIIIVVVLVLIILAVAIANNGSSSSSESTGEADSPDTSPNNNLDETNQAPTKKNKELKQADEELITVILPTINNDK